MSSFNFQVTQVTESLLKTTRRGPVPQPEEQRGRGKGDLYVISKSCTWKWCFEGRLNKGLRFYFFPSFKRKDVGEEEY